MLPHACTPYPETKIRVISPRLVELSAPWLNIELVVPKKVVQALIARNSKGFQYVMNMVAPLPFCIIKPQSSLLNGIWKLNVEGSIEQSILPSLAYNCWDLEPILNRAKIGNSNFYDPLSLYSLLRREINIENNFASRDTRLTIIANHDDLTFGQISQFALAQSFYLENSIRASCKIARKYRFPKRLIDFHLIESSGNEDNIKKALMYLMGASDKIPKIFHETKTIAAILAFLATHHKLAFTIALDYMSHIQQGNLFPIGKLLMQTKRFENSAKELGQFIMKNSQMRREFIPFQMLQSIGPTNRQGTIAAILSLFTIYSLVQRCNDKIIYKSNEMLQKHPPLVLLRKVT